MKKKLTNMCKSSLCCRATASLKAAVNEDLDKPDKSLGELLDEKTDDGDDVRNDGGNSGQQ